MRLRMCHTVRILLINHPIGDLTRLNTLLEVRIDGNQYQHHHHEPENVFCELVNISVSVQLIVRMQWGIISEMT